MGLSEGLGPAAEGADTWQLKDHVVPQDLTLCSHRNLVLRDGIASTCAYRLPGSHFANENS